MELHKHFNSHTKLKAKHKVFPNLMVQPVKCHKENISATLSHSSATKSKDIPKLGAAYIIVLQLRARIFPNSVQLTKSSAKRHFRN
jgi:hypothetical protein